MAVRVPGWKICIYIGDYFYNVFKILIMMLRVDGAAFCSWNKTPDNQLKKRKEILSYSDQRHCLAIVV